MVHASGGTAMTSDEASKKFGNAKAISSDMYFNRGAEMDVCSGSCSSALKGISLPSCRLHRSRHCRASRVQQRSHHPTFMVVVRAVAAS